MITEEDGGMRAYPLFPFDPVRNVEVFYMELESGVKHISEPHARGLEEYVLVVRGRLKVFVNDREIMLGTKQAMQFRADVSHGYQNCSDQGCAFYNVVFHIT